jgi:hypothetical protein
MSEQRREALLNALEASEAGELEAPIDSSIEINEDPIQAENEREEALDRDEKGRFVAKEQQIEEHEEVEAQEYEQEEVAPAIPRPTTWKKEYLPIWDKLTTGQQLTPQEALKLAEYSNQRESEYKKGVSTYKAEADSAKHLIEAINPFVPELQKANIHPVTWIQNLGNAHLMLTRGTPEQKVAIFQQLAQDYGIQLNGNQIQQQDLYSQQLMQQLQAMNQEVSTIKGRFEQEEQGRLINEIERVRQNEEQFPHFDEVRETMAQLLEQGLAGDLETAYAKAVRLQDDVWAKEQERLLSRVQAKSSKQQQVAKAKAKAVSPRSVTPNGLVATSDKKDRRSAIANAMGNLDDRY